MRKKVLLFLITVFLFNINTHAKELETVQAPTYYLASLETGAVLSEENCSANFYPKEFSKIMTAIIATEKLKETEQISFTSEDLSFNNSYGNIANVKVGDSLTLKEHLFNMLLLYSDASANALSRQISKNFPEEMNKKAKEFKMESTYFTSASGYDPDNKSKISVYDLANLAKKAYDNKTLKEVFSTVLFEINGKKHSSRNHLLSKYTYSNFTYSPATGMIVCERDDTCDIVATATKGSSSMLAIIVGSPKSDLGRQYIDCINLFEHGFNNFISRTICREKTILDQIDVKAGNKSSVTLETSENCVAYTPIKYSKDLVTYKINKDDSTTAPVKEGEILGNAVFYYDGSELATIPLVASEKVSFRLITPILSHIDTKMLFVVVILAVIFFVLKYNSLKKKEQRRKKRESILKNKD